MARTAALRFLLALPFVLASGSMLNADDEIRPTDSLGTHCQDDDGPIGGPPVGGGPVEDEPIGGPPVGGGPVYDAPIGGPMVEGAPVVDPALQGAPVGGGPVEDEPIGGPPVEDGSVDYP